MFRCRYTCRKCLEVSLRQGNVQFFNTIPPSPLFAAHFLLFTWGTEPKLQTESSRVGQRFLASAKDLGESWARLWCLWETSVMGKLILSFLLCSDCKYWPHPSPPLVSICLTDSRTGPAPTEAVVLLPSQLLSGFASEQHWAGVVWKWNSHLRYLREHTWWLGTCPLLRIE